MFLADPFEIGNNSAASHRIFPFVTCLFYINSLNTERTIYNPATERKENIINTYYCTSDAP